MKNSPASGPGPSPRGAGRGCGRGGCGAAGGRRPRSGGRGRRPSLWPGPSARAGRPGPGAGPGPRRTCGGPATRACRSAAWRRWRGGRGCPCQGTDLPLSGGRRYSSMAWATPKAGRHRLAPPCRAGRRRGAAAGGARSSRGHAVGGHAAGHEAGDRRRCRYCSRPCESSSAISVTLREPSACRVSWTITSTALLIWSFSASKGIWTSDIEAEGLQAHQGVLGGVRVDGGERAVVAGRHRLEHVEGLAAADLTDDDAVGAHAQGVADQVADGDLALALDVRRGGTPGGSRGPAGAGVRPSPRW